MNIIIAGATGLIGSQLVTFLRDRGDTVKKLVRSEKKHDDEIFWNSETGETNLAHWEAFDIIINLAGENIATRWSDKKKKEIRDSRVLETKNLCRNLAQLMLPPRKLLNASAVGYYGNQGSTVLTEANPNGQGFLADVCYDWENATAQASAKGIGVTCLRFGVVLSDKGGALKKMLIPFKLGLGGQIGNGTQFMSWISIDDLMNIVYFVMNHKNLEGAINVTSPFPVTNANFTKTLAKVLNRPTLFPVPEWAVKLAFGEMGEEALLSSVRAIPERLIESGYSFQYPNLDTALKRLT